MKKLHKVFIIIITLSAVAILFFSLELLKFFSPTNDNYLYIRNEKIQVELATTPPQWQAGLSGRKALCQNCGMLFIFPESGVKEFWMKGMLIPLDIIWIDDNKIIGIEKVVPAPEVGQLPAIVRSPAGVNMVLEVNAYQANNFKIGDRVFLAK